MLDLIVIDDPSWSSVEAPTCLLFQLKFNSLEIQTSTCIDGIKSIAERAPSYMYYF